MAAPQVQGTRLGVIVGHSLPLDLAVLPGVGDASARTIDTEWGAVTVLDAGPIVVLRRHGTDTFVPAHLLDHRASIAALCLAGCDRVLALASCGSLRASLPVGSIVVPHDFFAPWIAPSFFDDARGHSVPGFDGEWRASVIDAWHQHCSAPLVDGGVYAQTTGPRFESPAEVRMLAQFADIVGMTVVGECVLAREAGLAYAAVATVDNLANGIDTDLLTVDDFHAGVAANHARLGEQLHALLPALSATSGPER